MAKECRHNYVKARSLVLDTMRRHIWYASCLSQRLHGWRTSCVCFAGGVQHCSCVVAFNSMPLLTTKDEWIRMLKSIVLQMLLHFLVSVIEGPARSQLTRLVVLVCDVESLEAKEENINVKKSLKLKTSGC